MRILTVILLSLLGLALSSADHHEAEGRNSGDSGLPLPASPHQEHKNTTTEASNTTSKRTSFFPRRTPTANISSGPALRSNGSAGSNDTVSHEDQPKNNTRSRTQQSRFHKQTRRNFTSLAQSLSQSTQKPNTEGLNKNISNTVKGKEDLESTQHRLRLQRPQNKEIVNDTQKSQTSPEHNTRTRSQFPFRRSRVASTPNESEPERSRFRFQMASRKEDSLKRSPDMGQSKSDLLDNFDMSEVGRSTGL